MAGWNNKNCCCEPKIYKCIDGEVNICCMTLQESGWAHAISLYAPGIDPDDNCLYATASSYYHHNNACGRVAVIDGCTRVWAEVAWGIQSDGTVKLVYYRPAIMRHNGTFWPLINHVVTGLDPATWYLYPLVFTLGGVTHTLTVCTDPHEHFPEWPLSTVYLQASGTPITKGVGNLLCGATCDPLVSIYAGVTWRYEIETDEIRIGVGNSSGAGSLLVPYDDGNWIHDTHTVTLLDDIRGPTSTSVTLSDSCDIPPPPPVCEWENPCWPDLCPCLVDGSADPPVLYRTIYADVSGAVTATGLGLAPNNGTASFNYNSGSDYIVIQCTNGGMDPYYVAAQFSGVTYFFSIPANGLACTADGSQMVDETVTNGTITIRFYTL